ncbi:tetraacyldisaccharide 4'-kinase [Acetobacter cerevisiae]|nr:tetraacyldisaccharide 4'-kinase [Acetobacter cerevisiae]MCP1269176.1 tetraacyldisaccharide 4'-kinase [Acetobacter cerevisiae]MCP1277130.1 tetraacyldisaccharide 4'-kinase [Acetobacter cerevisiae]
MIRPPRFWSDPQARVFPWLLSPLSALVATCAVKRQKKAGWEASVPVLCCGNLTTGGTGKTTVVLDLVARLKKRKIAVHALTRGYGGRIKTATQVDLARHSARDVGDEALLLAQECPTWVGGDRAASAQAAVAAGATCLIMDDGFQNPGLHKDVSLLVVDGVVGLGNGHVLPAGPLRESPAGAFARASAVLLIGPDNTGFLERYAGALPDVMRADLQTEAEMQGLKGARCIAFAGLGRPSKFFDGLRQAGVKPVQCLAFPDHYFYKDRDMTHLATLARQADAQLVTTPKDTVRFPPAFRKQLKTIDVGLVWQNEAAPEALLDQLLSQRPA